jgi:uncharacterized membrane protein YtjA (UPF0391 family)
MDKIIEFLKLSTKPALVLAVFCAFLLFLPHNLLQAVGLDNLVSSSRGYFGILFFLACAILLVSLVEAVYRMWRRKHRIPSRPKEQELILRALSQYRGGVPLQDVIKLTGLDPLVAEHHLNELCNSELVGLSGNFIREHYVLLESGTAYVVRKRIVRS